MSEEIEDKWDIRGDEYYCTTNTSKINTISICNIGWRKQKEQSRHPIFSNKPTERNMSCQKTSWYVKKKSSLSQPNALGAIKQIGLKTFGFKNHKINYKGKFMNSYSCKSYRPKNNFKRVDRARSIKGDMSTMKLKKSLSSNGLMIQTKGFKNRKEVDDLKPSSIKYTNSSLSNTLWSKHIFKVNSNMKYRAKDKPRRFLWRIYL